MPQKTVKEWIQELPEPYRTEALENCNDPNKEVQSLSSALFYAFRWSETKQGACYWREIHGKIFSEGK